MRGRLTRRALTAARSQWHRALDADTAERAQANAAALAFGVIGTLIVGAFLWVLLDQAFDPLMDIAVAANNTSQSQNGTDDARTAWDNWAFFALVLILVMAVAGAAASSRRP